ncbi:MAG: hypothetical protein JW940_12205 [Polyangiaceae bacterium]|nr:hypothetical protein [Polyangiaceae bacterium]
MSDRPQREIPARGYPAIFPARPASLEPEAWPNAESGFRRADLLIASEPRLVSDDQLRDPRIPRAPSVPRVHVPGPRPTTSEQRRPTAATPATAVEAHQKQATPPTPAAVALGTAMPTRGQRWELSVVIACVVGFVAATLALVAGLL